MLHVTRGAVTETTGGLNTRTVCPMELLPRWVWWSSRGWTLMAGYISRGLTEFEKPSTNGRRRPASNIGCLPNLGVSHQNACLAGAPKSNCVFHRLPEVRRQETCQAVSPKLKGVSSSHQKNLETFQDQEDCKLVQPNCLCNHTDMTSLSPRLLAEEKEYLLPWSLL